jgi:hypothetical protein
MGEKALRRLQAGLETTRGTAVPATRKVYGELEPHRDQPRKFAMEDRGIFTDKFRANAKLVDAAFKMKSDLTFEDLPYWLDMLLKGGVVATGSATVGYTYQYVPDQSSDSLKTRTFEWGDDSIAWQGSFATLDSLDVNVALDDSASLDMTGFVKEWFPQGTGGFTGFTAALAERAVESVEGWHARIFIDPGASAPGTTQVTGRLVSAKIAVKNQNKRKWFGDASPFFTVLGRGRRQISLDLVLEQFDQTQLGDLFTTNVAGQLPVERAIRLSLAGSPITGTTFGTTNGALAAGVAVTSIVTNALTAAIPGGTVIALGAGGPQATVTPAGAALSALSVPVFSFTPTATVATGATIMAAKQVWFDFWGYFEGDPKWGLRETNVTVNLMLQAVYDVTAAKEAMFTVVNGLATAIT